MPKSKAKGTVIEVTLTHLIECGYSREHIKKTMATVNPSSRRGRVLYYDVATAIRALNNSGELPASERKELAQAELAEEKIARLKGQSIDKKMAQLAGANMIKIIVQTVKQSGLDRKACQKILKSFREAAERLPEEMESCVFEDGDV